MRTAVPAVFPQATSSASLKTRLSRILRGEVHDDLPTRTQYSRDTSIFERMPSVVVFPRDAADVQAVVQYAYEARLRGENVSIAPRSAGTDMTGGPLTDSIALVFTKYMNHIETVEEDSATVEPGAYYRDVEKQTLQKVGKIVPSYPASKQLCAIGGMIANNSGGELTLQYGKTDRYVEELAVVLSDGTAATLRPLSAQELAEKERERTLEGTIYREVHALLREHEADIAAAKPNVTKNSAGYALWNVMDKERGTFDLTQLIAGSQGTLAVITKAKLGLIETKAHRSMLVIFLGDINILPTIVHRVLKFEPESFESYDDQTFRLAVRFAWQIIRQLGPIGMIKLGLAFIPEAWLVLTGGVPKLVLLAEFADDTADEALRRAEAARASLHDLAVSSKIARSETESHKYWTIRRESFALLRKNLHGLHASSFIEDIVVHPDDYPRFLPELNAILAEHHLLYTIAGHIGDANFHIIPLMDLSRPAARAEILELTPKIFKLVARYKGSITGEHNDGIIRTPYLPIMYGEKICSLFAQVKKIFDPQGVLNPGKKVGGTVADIETYMLKHRM